MSSPYRIYMDMAKSARRSAAKDDDNEHMLGRAARDAGSNALFGMMANWRGSGPVSLVGSSVGGLIDGALMRPMFDGGIQLVSKGLDAVSDRQNERR